MTELIGVEFKIFVNPALHIRHIFGIKLEKEKMVCCTDSYTFELCNILEHFKQKL